MSTSTKITLKRPSANKSVFRKQVNNKNSSNKQNTPAQEILNLHQTIGNHAVQRLFESGFIQGKLTVGEPDDQYEKEADRVADEVMRMPEPQVQRQSEEDEEEEMVQAKPIGEKITPLVQRQVEPEEEEEETIQAKAEGQTPQVTPNLESKINALQGGGHFLSKETRNFFEPRFGTDFSKVKIHTDSNANQLARSINAKAFTRGNDIVFGGGEYSPENLGGKRLLGHELTHVVQQKQGRVQLTVQRSVTGEAPLPGGRGTAPTKWRVKMTGVTKMTGSGSVQTKPIADTVIFDPEPAEMVTLSGILTFKQYEYSKSWRWGDPKWRRRLLDIPFNYSAHFTGTNKEGTAQMKFSSDTKRKLKFAGIRLYEIEPSASGDTGLIKAKVFHRSHTMEVSTAIKLQPTKKEPIYIEREVTIDNFSRSKATVSAQNFKKVEDFWLSLTWETRKAIQDDKMLNKRKVQITGYTSNTDVVTNNFELGYNRAMAVRNILMKLSGNGAGTNLAAMSAHERAIATDDPKKEKEDATQRKVKIVLWQLPSPE